MSDNEDIEGLITRIQDLSDEERIELLEAFREDQLELLLQIRGEYIDDLREEGLLARFPEDSPWAEYCKNHPYDPICQRIWPQEEIWDRQRRFHRIQSRYIDKLREQGFFTETFAAASGPYGSGSSQAMPWEPWKCLLNPESCLPPEEWFTSAPRSLPGRFGGHSTRAEGYSRGFFPVSMNEFFPDYCWEMPWLPECKRGPPGACPPICWRKPYLPQCQDCIPWP